MKTTIPFAVMISLGVFMSSCGSKQEGATPAGAQAQPYPVFEVLPVSATLYTEYPATIEGIADVDIRPKIDGFIEQIYVDEGAMVKKGQVLFRINAPQYEQLVRTATAAVTTAQANLNAAQLQVNKVKPLVEKDIISKYELESAQLTLESRKAALAQANAELVNAKVNLGYTTIVSPADGLVGRIPFKAGSLVSPNGAQALTTVSNTSKVFVYFSLNEKQLLDFSNQYPGKNLQEQMQNIPAVQLVLADGNTYAAEGKIESINSKINTNTGSATLRATFVNPQALLKSGGTAVIRIPQSLKESLLIPQKSTMDLQGKKFVYVLGDSAKVVSTEIKIMENTIDKFYVVTGGLKGGEKIVLEGFQSLRDGMAIQPTVLNADSIYTPVKK